MRVICCIHSLSGGGAEHLMAGFASRLSQSHEVTLITLGRSADDLYDLDTNVERVDLDLMRNSASPLHGFYNNYRRITALRKAIRERRPEVVISFCDLINVMTVLACPAFSSTFSALGNSEAVCVPSRVRSDRGKPRFSSRR